MENISIVYRWNFSARVGNKYGQRSKNYIVSAMGSDFAAAQSDLEAHLKRRKLKLLHIHTIKPIRVDLAWYSDSGKEVPKQFYKQIPPPDIPLDPNAWKAAVLR